MDWRMVGVVLSVFQFIFMAVIFAVLKFNDMAHIDTNLKELKKAFHASELLNSERHIKTLETMTNISNTVSQISGRCQAFHKNK